MWVAMLLLVLSPLLVQAENLGELSANPAGLSGLFGFSGLSGFSGSTDGVSGPAN